MHIESDITATMADEDAVRDEVGGAVVGLIKLDWKVVKQSKFDGCF